MKPWAIAKKKNNYHGAVRIYLIFILIRVFIIVREVFILVREVFVKHFIRGSYKYFIRRPDYSLGTFNSDLLSVAV